MQKITFKQHCAGDKGGIQVMAVGCCWFASGESEVQVQVGHEKLGQLLGTRSCDR